MKRFKRLLIGSSAIVSFCLPAFAGGLHFGPISAVKENIGEYNAKQQTEGLAKGTWQINGWPPGNDGTGTSITTMARLAIIGRAGTGNGEFSFVSGTDWAGLCSTGPFLLVCDGGNHRVQLFDADNHFVSWLGTLDGTTYGFHTGGVPNADFDPEWGPRIGATGHIFVKELNKIKIFDGQGVLLSSYAITSMNFRSFCVDANDNVFIFASDGNTIRKYDSTGTLVTTFGGFGSGDGLFNNAGYAGQMAIGSNNRIYATDLGSNRVQVFDNDGRFLFSWSTILAAAWHAMCIDENGNVYVGSSSGFRKFSASGTPLKTYAFDTHDFSTIVGSWARSNKLYIADQNNNRVLVYSLP